MKPRKSPSESSEAAKASVDDYLGALDHPSKAGIELLRQAILGLDERIQEEFKWNAPSFRLDDHFATFRLHPVPIFQLVLHHGSKPHKPPRAFRLEQHQDLVKWAAPDRCVITFASDADAIARRELVLGIVKSWIEQL